MWTGLVNRKYAEYVMGAPASAGGFIATCFDPHYRNFLAYIPDGMAAPSSLEGRPLGLAQFRKELLARNSYVYLGRDHEHADNEGFATEAYIADLLDLLP